MASKRRTNDLIASEILKLCMKGASKTRIVYQANLNFLAAKPYLDNFTKKGFLEVIHEGSRVVYRTTPRGLELKERFEEIHSTIDMLCDVS